MEAWAKGQASIDPCWPIASPLLFSDSWGEMGWGAGEKAVTLYSHPLGARAGLMGKAWLERTAWHREL